MKRTQLRFEDSADDLIESLTLDVGCPQLEGAGGLELVRCKQNCCELEGVERNWSIFELKSYLEGQVKVYPRPVRKNLRTQFVQSNEKQRKEKREITRHT